MKALSEEVRQAILEIQVNAALAGHDLGPFEPVEGLTGGYETRCRNCSQSAWVGDSGLIYSLLDDKCPGQQEPVGPNPA